ncbi:hypothetical protein ACTU3I_07115 [Microbacterium sp. RD1]
MSSPVPPISPDDENPADELKTDVVRDVEREDTITGDFTATDDD